MAKKTTHNRYGVLTSNEFLSSKTTAFEVADGVWDLTHGGKCGSIKTKLKLTIRVGSDGIFDFFVGDMEQRVGSVSHDNGPGSIIETEIYGTLICEPIGLHSNDWLIQAERLS